MTHSDTASARLKIAVVATSESFVYAKAVASALACRRSGAQVQIILPDASFCESNDGGISVNEQCGQIGAEGNAVSIRNAYYRNKSNSSLSWCTYDLQELFESCAMVYVMEPFSAPGAAAFILAQNMNIPCAIQVSSGNPSCGVEWKWGMASLCEAVVCSSVESKTVIEREARGRIFVIDDCASGKDELSEKSCQTLCQIISELSSGRC
jgi:hypothetical protein